MRSISPTSGKGGGAAVNALVGSKSWASGAGTSQAGSRCVRRPEWLNSNSSSVDCVICMIARELNLHGLRVCLCEAIDLGPRALLRYRDTHAVQEGRVPAPE